MTSFVENFRDSMSDAFIPRFSFIAAASIFLISLTAFVSFVCFLSFFFLPPLLFSDFACTSYPLSPSPSFQQSVPKV